MRGEPEEGNGCGGIGGEVDGEEKEKRGKEKEEYQEGG